MSIRTAAAAAMALALCLPARAAEPSPAELAEALQRKYTAVRGFSADFTNEFRDGVLKKRSVERGTLYVKKPGKMRWDYKTPEEKHFVSDGAKMYTYMPQDK